MKLYRDSDALCFDDILLVPKPSEIESRRDIDLSMSIGFDQKKIDLYLPIIAAPMDTVCEKEAAIAMSEYGGMGVIHRFSDNMKQTQQVNEVAKKGHVVGGSVGVSNGKSVLSMVESLALSGAKVVLVDTANGHNILAVNTVREIRRAFPNIHIMAGNVSTWDGFLSLAIAGADSVRVGIGGGSMCSTRIVTGHGIPTLASIMEIYDMQERINLPTSLIADGGIRNAGDAVKAFAAGADAVMMGSLLAGHSESPGIVVNRNGKQFKEIRGMASESAQKNFHGVVSVIEGISSYVPYRGSLGTTLDSLRGGISSGCSYSGVHRLSDLQLFAEYVRVTPNSLGESVPHGRL